MGFSSPGRRESAGFGHHGVGAVKIAIAVHGRYHAFELARGLQLRGMLSQVATTYPRIVAGRFLPAATKVRSAGWLEAWRRAQAKFPALVPSCDPGLHQAFGRFAKRTLPDDADILVGWSSATLEAIPAVRNKNMLVVLERGSTHILHQKEVLEAEYERLGLGAPPMNITIIERELAEYDQVDAIAVPTGYAAETFVEKGVPAHRLFVNPYGADLPPTIRTGQRTEGKPKILFVGQVGVRKGVASLLAAFEALGDAAELHLVGPIEPGFEKVLSSYDSLSIHVHGPVIGTGMAGHYQDADMLCLPSIEEGFGLVLLEAMSHGLPVVATRVTGGSELVQSGKNGLLVEPGDIDGLAGALSSLVNDFDFRRELGEAGRDRVLSDFTVEKYCDRAIRAYADLLAAKGT
jgi:glycosyltransferase involved in cell wall biosynthesis